MLRYKKHKRQADGLGTNANLMDDTDREVSSFTDRAFRSLCVAEEELFNDVPQLPSPIRGMPLSTKYHLGIFNLSVRKTQPLAQLPTTPRQRGRWAPTFQPLLNHTKVGLTDNKTNNKLCAPVPRGFKQRSKVSSLIKTFDNIENMMPDDTSLHSRLLFSKGSQGDMEESPISEAVEKIDIGNESLLEPMNPDNSHPSEGHHSHRRTARDVFLESQTEMHSRILRSPARSPRSPLSDQVKKAVKERDSLRRTAFLHSEHSAFKSWSDINKRMAGGHDSDSSIPGTPPIPRSATPCSPLLQRAMPVMKSRDGGIDLGWSSPASSMSSNYDANQMLRTVPPLPNRKNTKQNRDSGHKTSRTPQDARTQDVMKTYEGLSSTKEQVDWRDKVNISKSPEQLSHEALCNPETELSNASQTFLKQNEEDQASITSAQPIEMSEITRTEGVKEPEKDKPPPGRIKSLIQQLEKEGIKEMMPVRFPEKKPSIRDLPKEESVHVSTTQENSPPTYSTPPSSNDHRPPWRKTKSSNITVAESKIPDTSMTERDNTVAQSHEHTHVCNEDVPEEKSSSFNISNLLTPVIKRKNIQEALEGNHEMTPPTAIKTKDQREIALYQKRDDYKSKATSLLFNLKDMRKRVKSTYNSAIAARNGYDNVLIPDIKMQEGAAHHIQLPDINKVVYNTENSNQTLSAENLRSTTESELKSGFAGNESENYLSVSPMDQIPTLPNGEIPKGKVIPDTNVMHEESVDSVGLSTNDSHIRKETEYPSLNLYSKADVYAGAECTGYMQDTLDYLKNTEGHLLPKSGNVREETNPDECIDVAHKPSLYVPERSAENNPRRSKQCSPSHETESQWVAEHTESERQVIKDDETKDILQYFAVNSSNEVDGIESNGKSRYLESQNEMEGGQEKLIDGKPRAESRCADELRRPSSITSFKPSLFLLKDNKIKSSPITRSVRPPLFRSLSEDCLVFKKLEDSNFQWRGGALRNTRESYDISPQILSTKNMEVSKTSKHQKHLMVSPTSDTPRQEAIEHHQIRTQKEEPGDKVLKEVYSINAERKKHEVEESDVINMAKGRGKRSPYLEESFFHPVETCVSEVTGPSPECNTLMVHNITDSMKELVNGEHIGSNCLDAENTNYSPIDNGLLQFEDSVSFVEDIACSTITSPISESVTCSVIASPMSVNTQSSGFTTALSALEDIPSPPSTSVNTRNGKFNFLLPEREIPTDSEPKNTDLSRQEKALFLESQKMHTKPPAVPPKTEKALRRAKRLTKKRRKTEFPQRIQDGDNQESDIVLDAPSPGSATSQSHDKLMSCMSGTLDHEDIISQSSTPSLPLTQRKLLQDTDSGQYFMVDIPVCLRLKTFYDPETGKYLQMSLPPSERESPAFDTSNSPHSMYSGLIPVPASSIVSFKGASQLLNHDKVSVCERESLWNEREEDSLMAGTPLSMDRITSRSSDIISMKDIDDFAMEAIS